MLKYDKYVKLLETKKEIINNKSVPFIISNKLKRILGNIKHEISNYLLELISNNAPITLLDIFEDESEDNKFIDYVTYANANSICNKYFKEENKTPFIIFNSWQDINNFSKIVDSDKYFNENKNKNKQKIGKVINKLFKDKFPVSGDPGNDIESFVDMYKKQLSIKPNFEIVNGEDIVKYYNGSMYIDGGGSLNHSCMRYDKCENYIQFYANNPDKVSMIILKDNDNSDLIKGRALLWNLDKPENRIYMDRIYTVNGYDVYSFIEYAEKNEWIYKSKQNMSSDIALIDTKNKTEIYEIYINGFEDNDEYPYMDTLKYYDSDNERLSNKSDMLASSDDDIKFLEDTGGEFEVLNDNRIYVEYYGQYFDEDDIIYCSNGEYRTENDCYYSEYYDEVIADDDDNYIECDLAYHGNDDRRLENDMIMTYDTEKTACSDYAENELQWSEYHDGYLEDPQWSEYHNTNIAENESITVYLNSDKTEFDYRVDGDGSYFEYKGDYYSDDVEIEKDEEDE